LEISDSASFLEWHNTYLGTVTLPSFRLTLHSSSSCSFSSSVRIILTIPCHDRLFHLTLRSASSNILLHLQRLNYHPSRRCFVSFHWSKKVRHHRGVLRTSKLRKSHLDPLEICYRLLLLSLDEIGSLAVSRSLIFDVICWRLLSLAIYPPVVSQHLIARRQCGGRDRFGNWLVSRVFGREKVPGTAFVIALKSHHPRHWLAASSDVSSIPPPPHPMDCTRS